MASPLANVKQSDIDRVRGIRSLSWFARNAWPHVEGSTPYSHNWHIDHMAAHLQAVTHGEIRNLIINVPPGSMKSLMVSVFWNAWSWIIDPSKAFLYTSFDSDLTLRDAGKVRTLIQSEWYQERWGNKFRIDPNEAEGEFNLYTGRETSKLFPYGKPTDGWRYSTSVNGKTTGRHPDIRVVDDPTKPKDATKANLEDTKAWWQNTMRSRQRNPRTVATVLIMQRLDEDDLAGYFLSRKQGAQQ